MNKVAELFLEVVPEAMRKVRTEFRKSSQIELTVPQLRVMGAVFRGMKTANELAQHQGISPVAISKIIQVLVNKGYLSRAFAGTNRKQQILALTPKGQKRFLKLQSLTLREIARRMERVSAKTKQEALTGLLALKEVLSRWEG